MGVTLEGVMKKTAMILIFVAALAASTQALSFDQEWPLFLARYGKQYSISEVKVRKSIFLDNLKYIERHNAEHALGLHTFSLGNRTSWTADGARRGWLVQAETHT